MNPPRLVPELPLPPYPYVPGVNQPHSAWDPDWNLGSEVATSGPESWATNRAYLYGFDLLGNDYFWEAHEVWESLWHAWGRTTPEARVVQGLIHLAAAGVKARQENTAGVRSHARRAAEWFRKVMESTGQSDYLGLDLTDMLAMLEGL